MSNKIVSIEEKSFFPNHGNIILKDENPVRLMGYEQSIGTKQKKDHKMFIETTLDKRLLPPLVVHISMKILFFHLPLNFKNIHCVKVSTENESGDMKIEKTFSTMAHFFINQNRYLPGEKYKNMVMSISERHQLNLQVDSNGDLKIEEGFKKIIIELLIQITGLGIVRDMKAEFDFWKAKREYKKEVKLERNQAGNDLKEMGLSQTSWLFFINSCLNFALSKDVAFLEILPLNQNVIYATKILTDAKLIIRNKDLQFINNGQKAIELEKNIYYIQACDELALKPKNKLHNDYYSEVRRNEQIHFLHQTEYTRKINCPEGTIFHRSKFIDKREIEIKIQEISKRNKSKNDKIYKKVLKKLEQSSFSKWWNNLPGVQPSYTDRSGNLVDAVGLNIPIDMSKVYKEMNQRIWTERENSMRGMNAEQRSEYLERYRD